MTYTVSIMTLDEYVALVKKDIDLFEKAYKARHAENSEYYPLELPEENEGLWDEFFIEFMRTGTT